jgi:gliding motility-associated-like protein
MRCFLFACAGIESISASTTDTLFNVGSNIVTFTAKDKAGNTATCQTTVTVQGNTGSGAFVNCPADIALDLPVAACSVAANWTAPMFDAPCGVVNPQITSNFAPGTLFVKGDTTVRYSVQGSAATCSFKVSVRDVTPPVLTCPGNITLQADVNMGCRIIAGFTTPSITDACDQNPVLTSNYLPTDTLPIGVTTIEYSAKDSGGNIGSCSFVVTVTAQSGYKISCPANIVRYAAPDTCMAIAEWNLPVRAVDICAKDTLVATTITPSGTAFPVGISNVVYTATDAQGNTMTCSFQVTVADTTAPVLTNCPQDLTVELPATKCDTSLTWITPTATDKCHSSEIIADTEPGIFGPGTTTVTFFAQDSVGNLTTCSFNITVEDKTLPVIGACPTDFLVQLPPNQCDTVLTWDEPVALDNCQIDAVVADTLSGSVFKTGETTVQYTATDVAGNTATCSFKITVLDKVSPVFAGCPKDTTIVGSGNCGAFVTWKMPTATDNCTPQADIVINASHPAMGNYVGTTDVRILARDASGNYDTCAFRIIVSSSGVPGFTNVPANKTFSGCESIATWDTVKTINFCKPPKVTQTHVSGDTFPIRVTTVLYTATDSIGNTYTATFTVTVNEAQAPAITCPKAPIILNAAGGILQDSSNFIMDTDTIKTCDGVQLYFTQPAATDNCGTPVLTQTGGRASGALFPIGTDTLKYEAVDKAGNKTTCRIPITIKALEALKINISPLPACQGAEVILQADSFPMSNVTYAWTGPQTNYPDAAKITVFSLNQGNAGTYSVQAEINGCLTPKASGDVLLVQKPVAEDDMFMIEPASTDTFDMFLNDVLVPLTDFTLTQIGPTPVGVTPLTDGTFQYVANPDGKPASFIYEMCSKTCPTLCDRATVTIDVIRRDCDFVPNIISPNGDQINDFLYISCLDSGLYPDNSIVIYNQWGDKVFEAAPYTNDDANGWKGELNNERGKDLPDGTYFYIFRPGPNQAPLKGFVDIFR